MANGSMVAMYKKTSSGSNTYYVHTDHLGSKNCVTDYMKQGFCEARTKPDVELIPTTLLRESKRFYLKRLQQRPEGPT